MTGSATSPLRLISRHRKVLAAVTRVEIAKKYSGSALGTAWLVLYPFLLLSMYVFVYSVVYGMQFPGGSRMNYVIYVFSGLIPYIGFMEAVTAGSVALKQNMHLIKNVMLPIELIPVRYVLVSLVTELISLCLLLGLLVGNGSIGWKLIGLPFALLLQLLFLAGLLWFLAPIGVALPDMIHFVNLLVLFLMFVSPIGFRPDMVPAVFRFMLYFNPIYYMTEVYRGILIPGHPLPPYILLIYSSFTILLFFLGSAFFRKFKRVIADYE